MNRIICGVDVSKARLDACCMTPEPVFESFDNSAALFKQAVAIEPNYAAAWAALAEASMLSALFGFSKSPDSEVPRGAVARDAVDKAMSINAAMPEAHLALAAVQSLQDWDWVAGERSFQRAIQLAAGNAIAHLAYGVQLACRGMWEAALTEAECALELDPASLTVNFVLGWLLGVGKRYDDAIAQHALVSRLAPDFPLSYVGLGWAHLAQAEYTDALRHFLKAHNLMRGWPMLDGCVGHCYARLDHGAEAQKQFNHIAGAMASSSASRVAAAAIQAGWGQDEEAIDNLEAAADLRDCTLPVQLLNPEFDAIRHHPRFAALLERMALKRARSFVMATA